MSSSIGKATVLILCCLTTYVCDPSSARENFTLFREFFMRPVAAALELDARVLMPIDTYGFGKKFTWVEDRISVSWQLI